MADEAGPPGSVMIPDVFPPYRNGADVVIRQGESAFCKPRLHT